MDLSAFPFIHLRIHVVHCTNLYREPTVIYYENKCRIFVQIWQYLENMCQCLVLSICKNEKNIQVNVYFVSVVYVNIDCRGRIRSNVSVCHSQIILMTPLVEQH